MIRAIIFDLDGTLVQSEKLKAQAYAVAAQRLRGLSEPDLRAVEAYREIVGAARDVASRHVMERLELEADLRPLVARYNVANPWDVLAAMRTEIYDAEVANPQVIRDNQWPHTVDLLRMARDNYCKTALATMSYREEALHVLRSLDLIDSLDAIFTREDVEQPKPDPEIYLLVAFALEVPPKECLVLEDSPSGVRAAVASGANVIALATPFTTLGLHSTPLVDHRWMVHDPEQLAQVVQDRIAEHNRTAH